MNGMNGGPFRGRFEIKLDPKGRLGLPSAYRSSQSIKTLETGFVVTNGRYSGRSCLDVYSLVEWEKLERRIAKLSSLKPEVQAFNRFYLSGGQFVEVDAQNRILVPQSLRRYASLDAQAVLIGLGNKFEIWSQEIWSGVYDQLAQNFDETVAAVAALESGEGDQ
jgi:MraZ protein